MIEAAGELPESVALFVALPWAEALMRRSDVAAAWNETSAVEGYTVGGLAGHLVRAVERTVETIEAEPALGAPAVLTDWYLENRFGDGVGLDDPFASFLRVDGEEAGAAGPAALADRLARFTTDLAARLGREPAERMVTVVRTPKPVPMADYLASRVVEIVVHGDDLVASVPIDDAPAVPEAAADVTIAFLVRGARERRGDLDVLRALTRAERVDDPGEVLRVL